MKDIDDFFTVPLDQFNDYDEDIELPADEVTATEPEAEPEPEVETTEDNATHVVEEPKVEEPREDAHRVPLAALQAEREKHRKAAEKVTELERQLEESSKKRLRAEDPIDPIEDLQGFHEQNNARMEALIEQRLFNHRVIESRARAIAKHGEQAVIEAGNWLTEQAAIDPSLNQQVFSEIDPAEWAIDRKKRFDLVKSFENDPDAYVRMRALELGYATTVQPVEAIKPAEKAPAGPASLVNAKARDSIQPQTPEDTFDAIFAKRK